MSDEKRPSRPCELVRNSVGDWSCTCGWAPSRHDSMVIRAWTEHARETAQKGS